MLTNERKLRASITTFLAQTDYLWRSHERLTEEYTPDEAAAFTFVFTDTEGQKTTVSYYEYDSSFYAAVTGDKVYLVNKMDIRDLTDACSKY